MDIKEIHRLNVSENRVLRRIFGPQRDEIVGGWRKLHNEDLHNLYFSTNIIRIIKSRRPILAGHIACMGGIGIWWESQKERDLQEDPEVGGRIMLKCVLNKQDGVVWTGFIWLRIRTSGRFL
jgi:hypothetical protein